jgi:formamidopyrimidine-DNA glycosylase
MKKGSMPELPEVETLCRQLKQEILGGVIQDLIVLDTKIGPVENMAGRPVRSVNRQGKFLLIRLDQDQTLHIHLRMSGRLLWQRHPEELPAHSRFMICFPQGRLACIDPRRFATLSLQDGKDRAAHIPDPLKAFNASILWKIAQGRQAPVKSFLLNQAIIAGIGNIYACEMLHEAAISPRCKAGSLSPAAWRKVARAGRNILLKATACRGTSISDWRDLYGEKGEYQNHLAVYGRKGLPCPRCGDEVKRTVVSGRGTYFCESCQK